VNRNQQQFPLDLNEMEAWVTSHLQPGQRVLEIGCGDGALIERLGADADAGFVAVGADPNGTPSDIVRAQTFETLDEAPFDVIFASMSLHHLADRTASVAALRRMSRIGTMLLVREFDWADIDEVTNRWWFDHYKQRQQPDGGDGHQVPDTFEEYEARWRMQMEHHIMTWEQVKSVFDDADFETVSETKSASLFTHALGEDLKAEEEALAAEGKIKLIGRRWEGRRRGEQ
jgi:ubiquinone/menaquinone biosynthesis C-methylase UbiE